MNFFFNVYKPKGPTSHDVVARLRRASGIRRIGHAGTLDPLAEGVLVVAVGQATRAIEYLADADKEYAADVTFGVETATYDAEGEIVAERPIGNLDAGQIERALDQFRGTIQQRPPSYSAISIGGKRLYDLARKGQMVSAPPREVQITRLELEGWKSPVASLRVECSKGTYIRSLAHDLGEAVGCGAYLNRLVRLRVGPFLAHNAYHLEELEARLRSGRWQEAAVALNEALAALPSVSMDEVAARRLGHGMTVPASMSDASLVARAIGPDGALLAIVRRESGGASGVWRPEKVFAQAEAAQKEKRNDDVAAAHARSNG